MDSGFWILDSIVGAILNSFSYVLDPLAKNSRFHKQKLPVFWKLDSLTWDTLKCV